VHGGAREYVRRMAARLRDVRMDAVLAVRRGAAQPDGSGRVAVTSARGTDTFDHVVLACHSDQALALLQDASNLEQAVLGAIGYQPNRAVLHTDSSLLPKRPGLWSAWNYTATGQGDATRVCVHYLINRLQPLPAAWNGRPVVVSLNPVTAPRADSVLGEFEYAHPVFDRAAIAAQAQLPTLQGQWQTWFCGAWTGYGFHEDGLASGLAVAEHLLPLLASANQPQSVHSLANGQT
jgi:predicted NAD/FAD-binding protein